MNKRHTTKQSVIEEHRIFRGCVQAVLEFFFGGDGPYNKYGIQKYKWKKKYCEEEKEEEK